MNRAVKIRIYPNKEQRVQIEQTIGCSRFIYNQMLADMQIMLKRNASSATAELLFHF